MKSLRRFSLIQRWRILSKQHRASVSDCLQLLGMKSRVQSCWGRHMARAIRKASGASVGINIAGLLGVGKSPGPVTFGDIVDNHPHIRKFGDQGWEIAIQY